VIHLLDERGRLCRIFAAQGADILLIDRDGLLRNRFRGRDQLGAAVTALGDLLRERG
jgi:hypothetical protein